MMGPFGVSSMPRMTRQGNYRVSMAEYTARSKALHTRMMAIMMGLAF